MSDYIELHAHSYYSLLDATASPHALLGRAAELGMPALAITDHNALHAAVPFALEAAVLGVQPIFGAELTLEDGHHLTFLVTSEAGWRSLCTLITLAQHGSPKGEASLAYAALEAHTEGLIVLTGCRHGKIAAA